MPIISMFFGIIVRMFYFDNKQHHLPHIHLEYGEFKAVVSLTDGKMLEGNFPNDKMKLVLAWMVIHNDELFANWSLAIGGEKIFKIESLK